MWAVVSWSKVSQVERRPYKNTLSIWTKNEHFRDTDKTWWWWKLTKMFWGLVPQWHDWNPVFHSIESELILWQLLLLLLYMSVSNGYASCVFRWSCRSAPNRGRAGLVRTNFQWFNLRIGPKTLLPDFMSLRLESSTKRKTIEILTSITIESLSQSPCSLAHVINTRASTCSIRVAHVQYTRASRCTIYTC